MPRIWKIISWVISTTLMIAALCFACIAIWAISGKRDLSQYNGYVEKSINSKLSGKHVTIGKTYLSWEALDELMALDVSDLTVLDEKNEPVAKFPKVILRYNFLSLMRGEITPSVVKLIKPEYDLRGLDFTKAGDGNVDLNKYNFDKFDSIIIQEGTVITPDGQKWSTPKASLRYDNKYIYTKGHFRKENSPETIDISYYTDIAQKDLGLTANIANFDSYELKNYLPMAAKAHVLLSGNFGYVSNAKEDKASFNITKVSGEIDDADFFNYKFGINEGKAAGSYDFATKAINVSNLEMGFADGFKVSGKGSTDNFKSFDLQADIANLKIASLVSYWPKTVKQDAILWLKEHVSLGEIIGAKAIIKISPDEVANNKILKKSVDVKFTFKDVDLKYSDRLADVKNGSGSGLIDGNSVKVVINSGTSGNTKVTNAIAEIRDIGGPAERLYVTAKAEGDASDLSEFYLNTGTGNKVIASKSDISGVSVAEAEVDLPLAKDLHLDQVKYHVKAKISNGAAKNLINKFDVSGINLNLEADNNSYRVNGQGLATYNKPQSIFALTAAPVSFDVASQNDNLKITVNSDITNSTITVAPLQIVKKAGEQGKLSVQINSLSGQKPQLARFALDSDSLKVDANGGLKGDYNNIENVQVNKLQFGKTDLTGRVMMQPMLTAEFKGSSFDMQPALRYLKTKKDDGDDDSEYRLFLQADNVYLLNQQTLKNAELSIHCAKIGCDNLSLHAHNVAIDQSGGALTAKVSETGNLLSGLGLYENMIGGTLNIDAKVAGKFYDGTITITDFYVVKARVLARMLTLGSLTGIADTVVGNGIRFSKLSANVKMDSHNLSVENYRMVGPAIGITANGAINRDSDIVSVTGNIIPAYTANTLLGHIPLIGKAIFSDEGVFALAYTMKGNIDNPDLSVNPLTVLAPGALRKIFE